LDNLITHENFEKVKAVMRERLLKRMKETGEKTPKIIVLKSDTIGQQRLFNEKAMYM
jgi:hypothetical protein